LRQIMNGRTPTLKEIRISDPKSFFRAGMVFRTIYLRGIEIKEYGFPIDVRLRRKDKIHYARF